jgi:serine/threonine protein kinase
VLFVDSIPLRLADRYRLEEQIGSGRMAAVWRAWDEVLARPVAVKVVSAWLLRDSMMHARLRDEAQAAGGLSHPAIVTVHDFGVASVPGGGQTPYIVMELLDGEDLASRLKRGALPWREASRVCGEVASALAFAHAAGIVHHDVKPANIFLTATGAKVLDFGIAQAIKRPAGSSPSTEPLPGAPAYSAPEQLGEDAVTPAADVYALGVVLAEVLTGRRGRNAPLPANVPYDIAALCLRCIAPDPPSRPSAAMVAEGLAVAALPPARGAPTVNARPEPAGTAVDTGSSHVLLTRLLDDVASVRSRRRRRRIGGGVVAAAVLVLTMLLLVGSSAEHADPLAAPTTPVVTAATTLLTTRAPAITSPTATTAETTRPATRRPRTTEPTSKSPQTTKPAGRPTHVGPIQTLTRMQRTVDQGVTAGEIRSDVGVDLGNLITNLKNELTSGQPVDLRQRVAELRAKIATRVGEGAITQARADKLNAILSDVTS